MTTVIVSPTEGTTVVASGGRQGVNGVITADAPVGGAKYVRQPGAWVAQTADQVVVTPSGPISSTDVAAALVELGTPLASLDKTFAIAESVVMALADSVLAPVVGVTKEQAAIGVTNSNWNLDTDDARFDQRDFALATTATPSATTGTITIALGAGSFAAADVGRRLIGNGGEAVLISAAGAAVVVADFDNTDAIASGSWALYGLAFTTAGVSVSAVSTGFEITNMVYSGNSLAPNDGTALACFMGDSGNKFYSRNGAGEIEQFNLTVAGDLSTASYSGNQFDTDPQQTGQTSFWLSPDGTRLFSLGANSTDDAVFSYTLSTAWDISSATYDTKTINVFAQAASAFGLWLKADGTRMYVGDLITNKIYPYTLATPFDLGTATYDGAASPALQGDPYAVLLSPDGTKAWSLDGFTTETIYQYTLGTAFDVTTLSYDTISFDLGTDRSTTQFTGLATDDDGLKFYVTSRAANLHYEYDIGTIFAPTGQYLATVTNESAQINTTFWVDINSMLPTETLNSEFIAYAWSTSDRASWVISQTGQSVRTIARNTAGPWQYNSNVTYASETWTNASTDDEFVALEEAMGVVPNRMTGANIIALADAEHVALTNRLDLAIILRSDDSAQIPISDGMTINYDASLTGVGAILGTDYDYESIDSSNVRFISQIAATFKIRIL